MATSLQLEQARALVIDGNPSMRSLIVMQLRDLGVGHVASVGRVVDARRQLEHVTYDFVVCEHHFPDQPISGQELLNDLRRNQLLPFSTVFIMVTGEATYSKVAEAAESALDGYLLKPYKPSQLGERLQQTRARKLSLQSIFFAIEDEDFEGAAKLCLERFEHRGPYWLYAARVGAELLLRINRPEEAKTLYEAVVAAKTLPWAKLGVARSMLDSGQPKAAASMLENLIKEDSSYTDAYDVMGRTQFEMGNFEEALAVYQMAANLTPHSISRLQNLGMMQYYSGEREQAVKTLHRCAHIGLDSLMFDCQSLVLMGFVQFEQGDHKALMRTRGDFDRLMEKKPNDARYARQARYPEVLSFLLHHQAAKAVQGVRDLTGTINQSDFDFEAACNLVALLSHLANTTIQLDEVKPVLTTLALRFCASRTQTDLLASAARVCPEYEQLIRQSSADVLKLAERSMSQSLRGNPAAAVAELLEHGRATLNGKLIETARLVLQRYGETIEGRAELLAEVNTLRQRCGLDRPIAPQSRQTRQAGGLALPVVGRSNK